MNLAWLTDIHLNFLSDSEAGAFCHSAGESAPDAIVVTGDIGEADSLARFLRLLAGAVSAKVYFVLGNHDFYRGSIASVRGEVEQLCREVPNLVYLTGSQPQPLSGGACLIGHDGWPDGRYGDFSGSEVLLSDFLLIHDFRRPDNGLHRLDPENKSFWLSVMQRLADDAATRIDELLACAVPTHSHIVVATHVPPFRESARYKGRETREDFQPFFASKAMGDVLLSYARRFPRTRFTVLCGHAHGAAQFSPLENLVVYTGAAEYGQPALQKSLVVE